MQSDDDGRLEEELAELAELRELMVVLAEYICQNMTKPISIPWTLLKARARQRVSDAARDATITSDL